jgi:hypothetical protein
MSRVQGLELGARSWQVYGMQILSKLEARNPKQTQMFKIRMFQTGEFRISKFEFGICFGFRNSDFGFHQGYVASGEKWTK